MKYQFGKWNEKHTNTHTDTFAHIWTYANHLHHSSGGNSSSNRSLVAASQQFSESALTHMHIHLYSYIYIRRCLSIRCLSVFVEKARLISSLQLSLDDDTSYYSIYIHICGMEAIHLLAKCSFPLNSNCWSIHIGFLVQNASLNWMWMAAAVGVSRAIYTYKMHICVLLSICRYRVCRH